MAKIEYSGTGFDQKIPSLESGVTSYKRIPTFENVKITGKLKDLESLADPYATNLIPSLKKTTDYESLNAEICLDINQYKTDSDSLSEIYVTKRIESLEELSNLVKLTTENQLEAKKKGYLVFSSIDKIYPEGFDTHDFSNYANPDFFYLKGREKVNGPKLLEKGKWSVAYNLFSELRKTNNDEFRNYELNYYALSDAVKDIKHFKENIIGNGTEELFKNYKTGEFKGLVYLSDKVYDRDDSSLKKTNRNLDMDYRKMVMMFPNEWENIEPLLREQVEQESTSFDIPKFKQFVGRYFGREK